MTAQPEDIVVDPALNGVHRLKCDCGALATLDGRSLTTRDSLLRALGRSLAFPDYYGANWDALEECLQDLSWHAGPVTICIEHAESVPGELLETLELIFLGAADHWRKAGRVCSLFLADSRSR